MTREAASSTDRKFTPGPWSQSQLAPLYIQDNDANVICSMGEYKEDGSVDGIFENAEANTRLIAAAPDLLEAAKQAKKYLEPNLVEPGRTVFWNLVAAITKAEKGKT